MPTRYTPVLRISKNGVKKSPVLPARDSMIGAVMAINNAMRICLDCDWSIDYSEVVTSRGLEYVVDAGQVNALMDGEAN